MARIFLKEPLKFVDGTGGDVNPNTDLNGLEKTTVTFNIDQDVGTSSNVIFNQVTSSTMEFHDAEFRNHMDPVRFG